MWQHTLSPRLPGVAPLLACPPLCPRASQACHSEAGTQPEPGSGCLDACQPPGLSPSPREAEASGCFQGAGNPRIASCELSVDDSMVISPEIRLPGPDMKALPPGSRGVAGASQSA